MQKPIKATLACLVSLIIFVILTVLQWCGKYIPGLTASTYYYIAAGVTLVVFSAGALMLRAANRTRARDFLQLRPFRARWLPLTLIGALVATLGAVLINLLITNLPIAEALKPEAADALSGGYADPLAPFLAAVLFPAIFEELFIHGALQTSLVQRSPLRGVLLSALVFGMLHSSPLNFFGPFFAAVVYGYMTLATGSVYPAMVAHFLNNLMSSGITAFGQNFFDIGYNGYFLFGCLLLFLVLAFIFLCLLEPLYKKARTPSVFTDSSPVMPVPIIVFALLWVAKMLFRIYNIL